MNATTTIAALTQLTPGDGRYVLLVDDDPIQLKLSHAQLTLAGFTVQSSGRALDALALARAHRPEVIVSDVLMGDIDGFALCRMFRADPSFAGVPVVLVSAQFQEEDDRKLALAVGASALVERSSDFKREIEAVMKSLTGQAPVMEEMVAIPHLYLERVASQLVRLFNKARNSEARHRALIENANDAITILSPEGMIIETNKRGVELLGRPHEALVGHHIREFAAPGYEQKNVANYQTSVSDAVKQGHVYPLRRGDGKVIFVEFTMAMVEIDGKRNVMSIGRDITESIENAHQLEESERNYRSLIENIPDVVWSADATGRVIFISPNAMRVFGISPDDVVGRSAEELFAQIDSEDRPHVQQAYDALRLEKKPFEIEYRWQSPKGDWLWMHNRAAVAVQTDGTERVNGVLSNITARRRLEDQLRQSQKMEAVGQLTGGVAHDFNNILSVILANSEFLIEDLGEQDPRRADALDIKVSAERAASLTRQLLAFSRRQVLNPTVLDLNAVTTGVERMLRRVIGEDVSLCLVPGVGLGSVRADAGQIEQVLMNLSVNARDAMPNGGALSIETANVDVDEAFATQHLPLTAGRYVMLAVTDTGCGMSDETKQRIFEPFFTTKEKGKGTGLGLSTSYGIVRQSGGNIWVYSELGRGTVFKIFLPRVDAEPDAAVRKTTRLVDLSGTETILLVEDDDRVRAAVLRILTARGYKVLLARNGTEAVTLTQSHSGPINLILSDVIIPGMTGPEIVNQVKTLSPSTRALFMSGYTEHAALRDGALQIGMSFIQKPFAPEALAKKVRETLDA